MIRASLVVIAVLAAARLAHAQSQIDAQIDQIVAHVTGPTMQQIAVGTLHRARRAIAIGPTVGAWGGMYTSSKSLDQAITFGLGLELFKVPVLPGPETVKALILERTKARLRQLVIERFRGADTPQVELENLARQVFEDVRAELLGENVRARSFERPRLTLALEANRAFEYGWLARARVGVGVNRVTLAMSLATGFGDDFRLYASPEVVVHYLTSPKPRSSVIDLFLRFDYKANRREIEGDQIVLGARFLLDLI
jgi:hypothetical protein